MSLSPETEIALTELLQLQRRSALFWRAYPYAGDGHSYEADFGVPSSCITEAFSAQMPEFPCNQNKPGEIRYSFSAGLLLDETGSLHSDGVHEIWLDRFRRLTPGFTLRSGLHFTIFEGESSLHVESSHTDPFYYDDQDALAAGLHYADTEAPALRPHLEMIRAFHAEERPDFIDPPGGEYRAPAAPDQLVLLGGLICLLDARHGIVSKDWPQSAG